MSSPLPSLLITLLLLCAACGDAAGPADGGEPTTPAIDPTSVSDAEFEEARNLAFRLFDQQRVAPQAIEALQRAHAMRPEAYGVNVRLGRALAERKLHGEALEHDLLALAAKPEDSETRLQAITLLTRVGRPEEALELVPQLLADADFRGAALYQQAYILDSLGRRAEALASVAQAEPLEPAAAYRAHSLHGFFLFQDGQYERGLELFERALQGRPDYKETLKGLKDCNLRLGRSEQAAHWGEVLQLVLELTDNEYIKRQRDVRITALERLVEIHGRWGDAWLQLADLQRREGDLARACEVFVQFLALHGATLDAAERARLEQKFCPGGLP